jgi:hypothetical protein
MAIVTPSRELIVESEVDFRSPVSEAVEFKKASTSNFVSLYQNKGMEFKFVGPFGVLTLPEDGTRSEIFDFEVVGISGTLLDRGTAGTTEVEIKYYRGGVDQGTILSTTLKITSGAGVAQFHTETVDSTTSNTNVSQLPVLSVTDFNAGDAIYGKLVTAGASAEQLSITVHYRPR